MTILVLPADWKQQIGYDPETGIFTWKINKRGPIKAGRRAGSFNREGYRRIKINQRHYLASHLAWAFVHGHLPKKELEHINGKKDDARIENLREATHQNNCMKKRGLGASYDPKRRKWMARICVNYHHKNLGRFKNKNEAIAAYRAEKRQHTELRK